MKTALGAFLLLAFLAMPLCAQACPAGQLLVPKLGGVTCQTMPNCPAGETMGIGDSGFECFAKEHYVAIKHNRFAFFALSTAGMVDAICMAWIPADSPYQAKITDDFLDPANHAKSSSGTAWVAAVSYRMNDSATKITLTNVRRWQLDPNGRATASNPVSIRLTVRLYDRPQSGWSCSKRTWIELVRDGWTVWQPG